MNQMPMSKEARFAKSMQLAAQSEAMEEVRQLWDTRFMLREDVFRMIGRWLIKPADECKIHLLTESECDTVIKNTRQLKSEYSATFEGYANGKPYVNNLDRQRPLP